MALLSTTLYLTPIAKSGGEFGTFGLKYTQKLSENVYFKIRYSDYGLLEEKRDPKIKVYFDFDF
jgi:hypothetical protein